MPTADGVVVELPHEIFAHVGRDGSVDMIYPARGMLSSFVQDIVGHSENKTLTCRNVLDLACEDDAKIISYGINSCKASSETSSSSSSDTGAAENLGDVIAHLAKEHAKRAQQSSRRVGSSAGGGAPPNDPRNNRNKNNGSSRFEKEIIEEGSERSSRDTAPIQKKECISVIEQMGFARINETSQGEAIFRNGRRYISFDNTSHNGGVWKMADSIKNLGRKPTRMGTCDKFLRRIGD